MLKGLRCPRAASPSYATVQESHPLEAAVTGLVKPEGSYLTQALVIFGSARPITGQELHKSWMMPTEQPNGGNILEVL